MQVRAGFRNFFKGGRVKALRIKGRGQAKLDAKMEDAGGRIYEAKGPMGPMCPAPHSPSL